MMIINENTCLVKSLRIRHWFGGEISLTESTDKTKMNFEGIRKIPSSPLIGVTSTASHLIGAFAASNIFCTAEDISGPIPSPRTFT